MKTCNRQDIPPSWDPVYRCTAVLMAIMCCVPIHQVDVYQLKGSMTRYALFRELDATCSVSNVGPRSTAQRAGMCNGDP
jgi:hypothetical protein